MPTPTFFLSKRKDNPQKKCHLIHETAHFMMSQKKKKCLLWYQALYLSRICARTSGKVANPILWSNEYITYSRVNLSTYFRTFAFSPLPIKCKKIKVRIFSESSIGRLWEIQWFLKFIVQNVAGIFHFIKVCHVDSDGTLSLNFAKYKV